MTATHHYYCAEFEDSRTVCFFAIDDIDAAYRADSMAKDWYGTALKDVYRDVHSNHNRRFKPYDQEILSQQLD